MNGRIKVAEGIYPVTINDAIYLTGTNKLLTQPITKTGRNLFNKDLLLINEGWWKTGVHFNDNQFSSYVLEVMSGEVYCTSKSFEASFWGEHGVKYDDYVAPATMISITGGKKITIPSNVCYLVLIYRNTEIELEMLNAGDIALAYEPYTGINNSYQLAPSVKTITNDKSVTLNKVADDTLHLITKNRANVTSIARTPLFIETYDGGGNQPIHMKVLYFKEKWNGFHYWMAYTPFPFGNDAVENPCICCSNNMIKWEEPSGINNPLDTPGGIIGGSTISYWSDTHIVFVNNRLELYYRGVLSNNTIVIVRRVSNDGIIWSEREVVHTDVGTSTVCPVVIHNGKKYQMWLFAKGKMLESADGLHWTFVGNLKFLNTTEKWHFDIIYKDGMYEMVQTGMYGETVEYLKSYDGLKWLKEKDIVTRDEVFYPNVDLYRPSFCMVNNYYNIFYTMNDGGYRLVGLSVGINPNNPEVYGIDDSYKKFMSKPTKRPQHTPEQIIWHDNTTGKISVNVTNGRDVTWKDLN